MHTIYDRQQVLRISKNGYTKLDSWYAGCSVRCCCCDGMVATEWSREEELLIKIINLIILAFACLMFWSF